MKTWTVEFDFFSTLNGVKPMALKTGFASIEDAQEWALDHTTDFVIVEEESMDRR